MKRNKITNHLFLWWKSCKQQYWKCYWGTARWEIVFQVCENLCYFSSIVHCALGWNWAILGFVHENMWRASLTDNRIAESWEEHSPLKFCPSYGTWISVSHISGRALISKHMAVLGGVSLSFLINKLNNNLARKWEGETGSRALSFGNIGDSDWIRFKSPVYIQQNSVLENPFLTEERNSTTSFTF